MRGGDEIRARFSYLNPENIKIEGNDDAEALAEFIAGNRKAIDTGDSHALNLAIDRYIADRPDSFLATVLLTRFYTTRGYEKRAAELYAMIPEEYRRDGFVSGYGDLLGPVLASDTVIVDNVRAFAGDSLAFFSPRGARLNLLMLTTDKSRTADSLVTLVTTLTAATADSLLRITDMGCDRDTLYWHRSMRSLPDGFPRRVRHMWLNAGPATEGIAQTAPAAIPFFILTDSAGHVLWRGESASAARAAFGRLRNN